MIIYIFVETNSLFSLISDPPLKAPLFISHDRSTGAWYDSGATNPRINSPTRISLATTAKIYCQLPQGPKVLIRDNTEDKVYSENLTPLFGSTVCARI